MQSHDGMKKGDEVLIIQKKHPWHGERGKLVEYKQYGLGWWGWRIELQNSMECFVRPDQIKLLKEIK